MTDPYQVLGISPDATDDELKRAYRALAKKYHPDNYMNTEFADIANEKMQAINDAYDTILKERANRAAGGSYHRPDSGDKQTSPWAWVRNLISSGRYTEAEVLLDNTPDGSAEWLFLKGMCAMYARRYNDAASFFSRASAMDPSNPEYAAMHQRFHRAGSSFGPAAAGDCDCCSVCSALLCADCMCEMCGGDLIGCC